MEAREKATPASLCRICIVNHHDPFAQGVRRILEARGAVEIVGMESAVAKALKAAQSLQPEVIIVEESTTKHQPMRRGAFLHSARAGRVMTLSLDRRFATDYQQRRMDATDSADLVKAIRGIGRRHITGPDQPGQKASMVFRLGLGRDSGGGQTGRQTWVQRTRRQGAHVSDGLPPASRGSRNGV